jgi:hypothetical protein
MSRMLLEYIRPDAAQLTLLESNGSKDICMAGLFIQGDVQNQNGRVYPAEEIARAVQTVTERLHKGETVMGELDHPEELQINLDRVSHFITEMKVDGSNGYGKLKLVETPMGNIARALIQAGAKLGVSSRGSGNVGDNGRVSDFEMITVDIVAQPSAPDAYPKTIYESLFNMRGGEVIHRMATEAVHDPKAHTQLAKDILSLIRELKLD